MLWCLVAVSCARPEASEPTNDCDMPEPELEPQPDPCHDSPLVYEPGCPVTTHWVRELEHCAHGSAELPKVRLHMPTHDTTRVKHLHELAQRQEAGGDHAAACQSVRRAFALGGRAESAWGVAQCWEREGKLTEAHHWLSGLALALGSEPEAKPALLLDTRQRLAELSARIAKLRVVPMNGQRFEPQAQLNVDGQRIASDVLEAGLELDPGAHRIEAWVPCYQPVVKQVQLTEGEQRTLDLGFTLAVESKPDRRAR